MKDHVEDIKKAREKWQESILGKRVQRFNLKKSPTQYYTPEHLESHSFLEKVGFPGEYPFTAGNNPFDFWRAYAEDAAKIGYRPDWGGAGGVGKYGGFGTSED